MRKVGTQIPLLANVANAYFLPLSVCFAVKASVDVLDQAATPSAGDEGGKGLRGRGGGVVRGGRGEIVIGGESEYSYSYIRSMGAGEVGSGSGVGVESGEEGGVGRGSGGGGREGADNSARRFLNLSRSLLFSSCFLSFLYASIMSFSSRPHRILSLW